MTHWQPSSWRYGLTFAALAIEVALLRRRRRRAERQARETAP